MRSLRCVLFGHHTGAPLVIEKPDGRTVLAVKCAECDFVSDGIDMPRPIAERWKRSESYWNTPRGRAWLDSQPSTSREVA
jgi:hypothetical protein